VIGIRVRIPDLPEQPGESKIPFHWVALPLGVLFLYGGLMCLRSYSRLQGPPLTALHEVKVASITNMIAAPTYRGSGLRNAGARWLCCEPRHDQRRAETSRPSRTAKSGSSLFSVE
jgi:hypothetical protein